MLGGGSVFGLAAADGIVRALFADGLGWPFGAPGQVAPIVPGAVLFDLDRGGHEERFPGPEDGSDRLRGRVTTVRSSRACVGAATGASSGGLKGAIGSASAVLPNGTTVAALVAVNSAGSPVDPRTGELYATRFGLGEEFDHVGMPDPAELEECLARAAAAAAAGRGGDPGWRRRSASSPRTRP